MSRIFTRLAATYVAVADYNCMPPPGEAVLNIEAAVQASRTRIDRLGEYFVRAWKAGADLVAGYESVTAACAYAHHEEAAPAFARLLETVPGPTTERIGALARQYRGYCVFSLEEKDGDAIYNTAVLIDRDGRVAGKYQKVHLPPPERVYATAGNTLPVFETDFGRVGLSICYDLMFPEASRTVALQGADLLVHLGNTTYTHQEETLRVRAADNAFWLLASNVANMISMIVDPAGYPVARATRHTSGVILADIDLTTERELPKDNAFSTSRSLRGRMLQERVPAAYGPMVADRPPFPSFSLSMPLNGYV